MVKEKGGRGRRRRAQVYRASYLVATVEGARHMRGTTNRGHAQWETSGISPNRPSVVLPTTRRVSPPAQALARATHQVFDTVNVPSTPSQRYVQAMPSGPWTLRPVVRAKMRSMRIATPCDTKKIVPPQRIRNERGGSQGGI